MRDPLSREFSSLQPSQDSWFQRVRGNFQQLLTPARIFPSSANGAPIHLLRWGKSARSGRAQGVSLLTHAAIIFGLAFVAAHPLGLKRDPLAPSDKIRGTITVPLALLDLLRATHPSHR